ncbi:hypothetical protein PV726_46935 [Streptomyces europaeiscabiei]|nr:hypothetical protein [Streptomyces europaeiscabiei]MDX3697597.1 hypothetical protein [Streptomyces europaeiscabiei]
MHAQRGGSGDQGGSDQAAVFHDQHARWNGSHPVGHLADSVQEHGDGAVAEGVGAHGPAALHAHGQGLGQLGGFPEQFAVEARQVGIGLGQRGGLDATVEDELQPPKSQPSLSGSWRDALGLKGVEVGGGGCPAAGGERHRRRRWPQQRTQCDSHHTWCCHANNI